MIVRKLTFTRPLVNEQPFNKNIHNLYRLNYKK